MTNINQRNNYLERAPARTSAEKHAQRRFVCDTLAYPYPGRTYAVNVEEVDVSRFAGDVLETRASCLWPVQVSKRRLTHI